jgi:hypothetical protein
MCSLVFSRNWNLQRHLKLMHGFNESLGRIDRPLKFPYGDRPTSNNRPSIIQETLKELSDFDDLLNKTSNPRQPTQTADYQNSLESQLNSLRQKVASYEKRISDLLNHNLLFSKGAAQGISGYACKRCQTFSFKAIFDPGYDMTMESKHRCTESHYKRSYNVIPIPPDIPDVDDWAAKYLLDQVNFYIPIGKYLIATDMTKCLNDFSNISNAETAREIVGVPHRYPLYSFENNSRTSWIDRAIDNLNKKIAMADVELLDFFRRVKSTYAIFEIPIGGTVRQFFMFFTNY